MGYSEVILLGKRENAALCPSVYCVLLIYGVGIGAECGRISLSSIVSAGGGGGNSSRPAAFLFLIFLSTKSNSSWVNCPSLMSIRLLIIFVIGSSVTFGGFPINIYIYIYIASHIKEFTPNCFCLDFHFLLNQRYQNLISFMWPNRRYEQN